MGITLSKEERCEVSRLFADDLMYKFINNFVTDITYQHPTFPLTTQDVYCAVIDSIDTIRENEGTRDCITYIDSLYKQLCVTISTADASCHGTDKEVSRITAAVIVYTISSLLTISRHPQALKYAMALQMSIDDPDYSVTRILSEKTESAIKAVFSEQSLNQWREYYMSDMCLSMQIEDVLDNIRQFDYINMHGIEACGITSYEQFITDFRKAAEADADTLVKFLLRYMSLGYIEFHHDNLKQIYEKIHKRFPTMKNYDYANFAKYAKKDGLSLKLQEQLLPKRVD